MENLRQVFISDMGLSETYYDEFMLHSKTISLTRKEFLIREGTICRFIGFVQSGVLRSFFEKDEKEYISDFYFPNSVVTAYTSFLTQTPVKGSIQALEQASVCYISHQQFNQLLQCSSEWFRLGKYISDFLFIKKCKKETALLKDSAIERFHLLLETYPDIEQQVSQYNIASYLGIKPESLSRIKSLTYINK